MNRKALFQSIISIMQKEIPFNVLERETSLPVHSEQIIAVTGVRRCGKSSLMKLAANKLVEAGVPVSNILWINFDDERLDGITALDLDDILNAYREMYPDIALKDIHIFLDEVQYVDKWELFVMRVYKTYCKNIYVSGSNSKMLSAQISTALRGWPLEFIEYPLSFKEYLFFKKIEIDTFSESGRAVLYDSIKKYISSSAFPEIVLMNEPSLQLRKVQGYFNAMMMRDLAEYHSLSQVEMFRYTLKRIMADLSKPMSINKIYNDIKSQGKKVDKNKLYEFTETACNIFMFFRVNRWSKSLIEENNRLPKYYVIDNGMRNAVIMPQSHDNGKLLENAVFLQLKRISNDWHKIYYFSEDNECDFVVQENDVITQLIQVCWDLSDENTLKRELRGLVTASKVTKCKKCTIINIDEDKDIEIENIRIRVIPAWKWFLNLT